MYNNSMNLHKITESGTHYWIYNDDSKKPTIVMIHGFRGTHHGLELIAKNLNNYRIIIPDLPGFGETIVLDEIHSLENFVKWLKNFLSELGLQTPPYLLGHSFGSIVTGEFVAKNPDSVKKLIIVNPIGIPALTGSKIIMTKLTNFYFWLGKILPAKFATRWLSSKIIVLIMSSVMAKTRNKKTRKYIHNQHLTYFSTFANSKSLIEAYKTSTQHSVRESAPHIFIPTLIIAGDRDDITPIDKQFELNELFPKAEIKVIKEVGHLTQYEKPQEVAGYIRDFLN